MTFDEIPPIMIDATTAVEDKTFWSNAGFDPVGIISAGLDTLTGNARGASTITQQLVRNRLLPDSAFTTTYERKIREIIQSIRLTQAYAGDEGKKQIIAAYLNDNFYGNNSYGIAAAARGYWNIELDELTLPQAAILAAIFQQPTTYDLMRNAVEEELADGTTRLVVPADSAIVAAAQPGPRAHEDRLGPHGRRRTPPRTTTGPRKSRSSSPRRPTGRCWPRTSSSRSREQLGSILCGAEAADSCPQVDTGGYRVVTTLDWRMQKMAEKWVEAGARAPNAKDTAAYLERLGIPYRQWIKNMKGKGVHNAALAAVDYRSGQVYAYAGSAGFYLKGNRKFQPQFDVLEDGWRQPGSAFKPISYLIGIEDKTLTAATLFMDVVTDFGGGWTPADADRLERGPVAPPPGPPGVAEHPGHQGGDPGRARARLGAGEGPRHPLAVRAEPGRRLDRDRDRRGPHDRPHQRLRGDRQPRRPRPADDDPRGVQPGGREDLAARGRRAEGEAGRERPGRLHHDRHPGLQHRPGREPVLEPPGHPRR